MISSCNSAYDVLKGRVIDEGYMFFDSGDYDINIIGERNRSTKKGFFGDSISFAFTVSGIPVVLKFDAVTDAVKYKPLSVNGNYVLPPGQYIGLWELGFYGNYRALIQKRPVKVFTDSTKTQMHEIKVARTDPRQSINLHRKATDFGLGEYNKTGPGCQIIKNFYDFEIIVSFITKAINVYKNSFSYTLLENRD